MTAKDPVSRHLIKCREMRSVNVLSPVVFLLGETSDRWVEVRPSVVGPQVTPTTGAHDRRPPPNWHDPAYLRAVLDSPSRLRTTMLSRSSRISPSSVNIPSSLFTLWRVQPIIAARSPWVSGDGRRIAPSGSVRPDSFASRARRDANRL